MMNFDDLFSDEPINKKETIKNVKKFFKYKYPRLHDLAHSEPLQAMQYNNIKVTTSKRNTEEDKAIRRTQAKIYIELINQAINRLDETKKIIFKCKLINNIVGWKIEEKTGYRVTQMYKHFNDSCIEFALILSDISDIDLIIYEEERK